MKFDWHGGIITRDTVVDGAYKNTRNVRRFMSIQCGAGFKFDRSLMAWIGDARAKTMGEVVDEWQRRRVLIHDAELS